MLPLAERSSAFKARFDPETGESGILNEDTTKSKKLESVTIL